MIFNKILQPKHNPFGLYIYSIKDNSIIYKSFSPEIISLSKLSNYKGEGTYCNSYNYLFISESNEFWVVNHSTFQIRYKKMPVKKNNHSIIYIPSSNPNVPEGKVYIVGGNDKKSFYYDLKKNYFLNWAPTNELHKKPAVLQIGDYLYLFDSIQIKDFCFERTNLLNNSPQWEKIIPKIEPNIIYFPSQTFAASLDNNNKVVFLGGDNIDMANNNTFIYDIDENRIYLSEQGTNDNINFIDKTFYEIDNQYNVALPEGLDELKEVAIIDKNEQSLIRKNFDEINNLCQESQNDLEAINKINTYHLGKKISIKEPKEYGYYISSCSSEESKIKARNDKIQVIDNKNQKHYEIKINEYNNIQVKKQEKKSEIEVNINIEKDEKIEKIENKNLENIRQNEEEENVEQKPKMQIEIPEIQQEQNIEEKPQFEEIKTDMNQTDNNNIDENNNINNEEFIIENNQSNNQENNNIYIKDSVGENNQEELEQKYAFVEDHEEKEPDNQNMFEQEKHQQDLNQNENGEEEVQNEQILEKPYEEYEEKIENKEIEHEGEGEFIEQENSQVGNEEEHIEEQLEEHLEEHFEEQFEEHMEEHVEENIGEEENFENEVIEEEQNEQEHDFQIHQKDEKEGEEQYLKYLQNEEKEGEEQNIRIENEQEEIGEEEHINEQINEHINEQNHELIDEKNEINELKENININEIGEENIENIEENLDANINNDNNEINQKEITDQNKEIIVEDNKIITEQKEEFEDFQDNNELQKDEAKLSIENHLDYNNIQINPEPQIENKEVEDPNHQIIEEKNKEIEQANIESQPHSEKNVFISEHNIEDEGEVVDYIRHESGEEVRHLHQEGDEIEEAAEYLDNYQNYQNIQQENQDIQEDEAIDNGEYEFIHEENVEENNEEAEEMHFGDDNEEIGEENDEFENEEEQEQNEERDTLLKTLTQNIGEDVMQIPDPIIHVYYDKENFCDYQP